MLKYILIVLLLTIIGFIFRYFQNKEKQTLHYDLVSKYLLRGRPNTNRPILWVYIPNEINARNWKNWGSRNTTTINIPYIQHSIQSIIKNAEKDFNIYFITNDSFSILFKDWNINIDKLANPERQNIIHFALLRVLYTYGGLLSPMSFLSLRPLKELYEYGIHTSDKGIFFVSTDDFFIGAKANSCHLKNTIQELQELLSGHHSIDTSNRMQSILHNNIYTLPEQLIGKRDIDNNLVHMDQLLSESPIYFHKRLFGIVIPTESILRSTKYQWFAYVHYEDIKHMNNTISKLLLLL